MRPAGAMYALHGDGLDLPVAFGKYELLERIATGGMAEIYLARSFGVAGFERRLVIKRIREEHAQDPRFVSMFIHEAKIGVHLNHSNIVQVYDLGKEGPSWYIAMEHIHGRDLNKLVKALRAEQQRLPLAVAVAIVAEVCRGLAYAHGNTTEGATSLVHRDVSPHNVVVTYTGEVKIVDFGIARLINTQAGNEAGLGDGRPGGGKYAYMSPEQANGEEVDHRTDIFSAGIVLWELIVGHRLFQDPDPAAKLARVRAAVVPDPAEEGIVLDDELRSILRRALARSRDERYASANLFEEDLRAWLFHRGERVGRTEIAAEMARAFPTESSPVSVLPLDRLLADMENLDAATLGTLPPPLPADPPEPSVASDVERKSVVVLIVDLDGLTELSARVEPEILFRHHFQILRWMRRIVDRFGGKVQRAVDDQVLVLFGVPRTRADDVARALECALELRRCREELGAKAGPVDIAVGIHSGEVTLAPRGRHVHYEARGDTTRFARRLSAAADHDQILVSEKVLRAAGGDFRFKRGPDIPQRGGRAADWSYVLLGRHRGVRIARTGPWLRRGNELDVIRGAVADLASGRGGAILLTGPEGTGKSRLVREIRDLAARRGVPVYVGRSSAYREDGVPFAELVRAVLGFDAESPWATVKTHLDRLAQLGLSRRDIDAIANMLSPTPDVAEPDSLWQAIGRMLAGLGADVPALVALEEVHLLAPRHLERLRRLVLSCARHPVLLLLTWRGAPPDTLSDMGTCVDLGAFATVTQRRMLENLLEAQNLHPALLDLVERTCEGNPLYLSEMVKYLLQQGRVEVVEGEARLVRPEDEPELPDSLAGILAARLDKLDPAAKGALKIAAIIGKPFSSALLAEAIGIEDPTPILAELQGHGLIQRLTGSADTWRFRSELVRQATLRGILGVQRRDYHRMIAAAIEKLHGDDRNEWSEALARHWAEGGKLLEAAKYAFSAGENLERQAVLDRARDLYEAGLRWIREVPESTNNWDTRVQGEAMLGLRSGVVHALLGDLRKAEAALQISLDIASDAGLPWIEARAHVELGRLHLHRGRLVLANAHLGQARELLALHEDDELLIEALEAQAILADEEGHHVASEELWREALQRAEDRPQAAARALIGLANRHLRAGQFDDAAPLLEHALIASRRAGDRITEGRVLNNIGLLHAGAGRYDDALDALRRALEVREGIGYLRGVVVNHHNIGDVHFVRGDAARAHVAFSRSREIAAEIGWERGIVLNDVYLAYLDTRGRAAPGAALERLRRAALDARRLGDVETSVTGRWLLARALHEAGQFDAARPEILAALEDARKHELRPMTRTLEALLAESERSVPG